MEYCLGCCFAGNGGGGRILFEHMKCDKAIVWGSMLVPFFVFSKCILYCFAVVFLELGVSVSTFSDCEC